MEAPLSLSFSTGWLAREATIHGMPRRGRPSLLVKNPPNRLRETRLLRDLTLDQVSDQIAGLDPKTLGKYETGVYKVTAERLQQIAEVLGVRACELLNDYDAPRDAQERELLAAFRKLTGDGKSQAIDVVEALDRHKRRA